MEAIREVIPPEVLAVLKQEGVDEAKQRWRALRKVPTDGEVASGVWKRRTAPKSTVEDRRYVPGALRHWRKVHGLSPGEALARIGYAKRSRTWANWEVGRSAPPYETLLRIIAATGLGHWVDEEGNADVDPDIRLDVLRDAQSRRNRKRRERIEKRNAAQAAREQSS